MGADALRGGRDDGYYYRSTADPQLVAIDLEFETVAEAEQLLGNLRRLWAGAGGAVMRNPEASIFEAVESRQL